MENEEKNIEQKVMAEINSGKVKLRSKYFFWMEKLGVGGIFALVFFLAIVFFSLILFYLRATDNWWYLSFGSRGLGAFLESFPYLLVIVFIGLILIAGTILKVSNVWYKKSFVYLGFILLGIILFVGTVFAVVGGAERIEGQAFNRPGIGRAFRPFLNGGLDDRGRGIAGRVIEIGNNYLVIQTPHATRKVELNGAGEAIKDKLSVGEFIVAIGEKEGDAFKLKDIQIIDERMMPMINHGVHRRFGAFDKNSYENN